jgi:hypothetical protein
MKKKVTLILGFCLLILLISFNIRIKDKEVSIYTSIKQEALACNIIPEGVEDFCWYVEYFPEYYTCTVGGIWSCYV